MSSIPDSFIATCPSPDCGGRNRVRRERAGSAVCGRCGTSLAVGTEALQRARTMAFTARVRMAAPAEGGGFGELTPGPTLAVRAVRPGSLRIEAVTPRADSLEELLAAPPFDRFVADGNRQIELSRTTQTYAGSPAPARLEELSGTKGLVPLVGPDVVFAEGPPRAFQRLDDARLESGEVAAVFGRGFDQGGERIEHRLFLAPGTGLPMRLSLRVGTAGGALAEVMRTDYADWKLDAPLPAELFDPTPPPETQPEPPPPPPYDPALVPGAVPPPFAAATLDGRVLGPRDFEGRVLLLHFWATWFPPCRESLTEVRALYERYHAAGLEILGISLDPEELRGRVAEVARAEGLPWPQACDGQEFDGPVADAYGVMEVPVTVVIGRDGRVAAAGLEGDALAEAVRLAVGQ